MRLKQELIANRYKIKNIIFGGMSVIHLCEDQEQNNELVVLKTLKSDYSTDRRLIDQFLREAVIWVEMGWHPNIVQAYRVEYDPEQRKIFLVLEYVPTLPGGTNPTLRSQLTPGVGMGFEKSLKILLDVARGMKYATQQVPGLIHCDIKPENIFIGPDGTARIGDFGLALLTTELFAHLNGSKREHLQTWTRPAGTPYYMSPEQWRSRKVSICSDIYSLGCVGYEMFTGVCPVNGRHFRTIAEEHIRGGAIKRVTEGTLPLEIKSLLFGCLDTDALHRFKTWGQVEQEIIQCYEAILHRKVNQGNESIDTSDDTQVQKGRAILSIGEAYLDMHEHQVAIKCFEKARAIGKSQIHLQLIARSEANIGMAYLLMDQREWGFFHYKKAFDQMENFTYPEFGIIIEPDYACKPI